MKTPPMGVFFLRRTIACEGKGAYAVVLPSIVGRRCSVGIAQVNTETRGVARRSAEDIRLIAEAKRVLMLRCHFTEPQAHRSLQRLSMETSRPLVDVAQQVVALLEVHPHE